MKVIPTQIPDVLILEPKVFGDERGFFMEVWNEETFNEAVGQAVHFMQDNHSRSLKNTLRGLHYQIKQPQGKLVRVTRGEVLDVAVDLRPSSPNFGKWVGEYLSEENKRMLWVPPKFAHGFLVTSETADFQYKCTDFYAPNQERTLAWSDPVLQINWGADNPANLLLSPKDQEGQSLEQAMAELKEHY